MSPFWIFLCEGPPGITMVTRPRVPSSRTTPTVDFFLDLDGALTPSMLYLFRSSRTIAGGGGAAAAFSDMASAASAETTAAAKKQYSSRFLHSDDDCYRTVRESRTAVPT